MISLSIASYFKPVDEDSFEPFTAAVVSECYAAYGVEISASYAFERAQEANEIMAERGEGFAYNRLCGWAEQEGCEGRADSHYDDRDCDDRDDDHGAPARFHDEFYERNDAGEYAWM